MPSRRKLGHGGLPSIGQSSIAHRILSTEPFDAHAEDGDGDGMVQDGTQWERPTTKPVSRAIHSIANRINGNGKRTSSRLGAAKPVDLREDRKPVSRLRSAINKVQELYQRGLFPRAPHRERNGLQAGTHQVTNFIEKMNADLLKRFDANKMHRLERDPGYALDVLARFFPNAHFEHDFDKRGYSSVDAMQAKALIHRALNDPTTAAHLKTINWHMASTPGLVTGSYRFDGAEGRGVLTIYRMPHLLNAQSDAEVHDVLMMLNAQARDGIDWSPINHAIRDALGTERHDLYDITPEEIIQASEFKVLGTVLHEWGHAAHHRTIFQTEFGIDAADWSNPQLVKKKLYDHFDDMDKKFVIQQALFAEEINKVFDDVMTKIDNMHNIPVQEKSLVAEYYRQQLQEWGTFFFNSQTWMHNMDESTGVKEQMSKQLISSISYINDLVRPFDPNIDLFTVLGNTTKKADSLFEQSPNGLPTKESLVNYLLAHLSPEALPDINAAIERQLGSLIDQKILDSLSEEVKAKLVKELEMISGYAGTNKSFTDLLATMDTMTMGQLYDFMANDYGGGWLQASARVAIFEGLAELFQANELGLDTSSKNFQDILKVLHTKAEKMSKESQFRKISYEEYLKLQKEVTSQPSTDRILNVDACNWINANGPVQIVKRQLPEAIKKKLMTKKNDKN